MTSTTHTITSVTEPAGDGSVQAHVEGRHPFNLSADWLSKAPKTPAPGDTLVATKNAVTLVPADQAAEEDEETPPAQPTQKKTDGGDASGSGSKPFQPNYVANPVEVEAFEIVSVASAKNADGSLNIALSNGENEEASAEMLARITPKVGDYWVTQADGYVYLNPKDVFERKYAAIKG